MAGVRNLYLRGRHLASWLAAAVVLCGASDVQAQQTRSLGLDISAWQGNMSQTTWDNILNVENREFVFIRSSRGGTTGYYNQSNAGNNNPPGQNTLSQRYDDPYFIQNITRATKAGMYAGTYHFGRMDIIASTLNSNGIPNSGADEANHFLQMAGPWMRPGYMLPVFDLEAGISERTGAELAQFAIDFSDTIYAAKGIRPAVYIGGNYTNEIANESNSALEAELAAAYPTLWNARWPNQSNPDSIDVQNGNPKDSYANFYGSWDDPNDPHPWHFWQYASTGRLQSFNNGNSNLDFDVAHGGVEYLKDHLVPALWTNDASGDWGSMANWNSGVAETEPVTGPGQVPRVGPAWTTPTVGDLEARPTPRLPGTDDAAVQGVYGSNDTVVLDRGAANPTITLSSGNYTIRRLQARETLNITGGSLTVGHAPSWDSPAASAQISAPVSVSGGASLSVHTLDVDASQTLTVGNATFNFQQVNLASGGTPGKIVVNGDLTVGSYGSTTGTVANSGLVDLAGGNRNFNVTNGPAAVDVAINAPITNGALTKSGAGTLALGGSNTYAGDTTVMGGTLSLGTATLADASSVFLTTGATLNLEFGGSDAINKLFLDGNQLASGTWGATGSGADFTSPWISGSGWLSVDVPPIPPGPGTILDNFDVDEGHFTYPYNFSPPSQTAGLSNATTIDRVTTEAQAGAGSQLLNLVSDGSPSWKMRHSSGTPGNPAVPAGNVPLDATGYVGFWLMTDDAGVQVQIVMDDPGTGEMGTLQDVIADGQWHLYQWNLEDDSQWDGWVNGNGAIDEATVTIDSIYFWGSGDAQIYLDTVSHNPDGMLGAPPIPGDFDGDNDVDGDDLADWKDGFGTTSGALVADGDADDDGDVDGNDFLVWQRNVTPANNAAPVPEPAAGVLALLAAVGLLVRRRK